MTKTIPFAALAAILLLALAPDALAKSPEELSSKAAIAEKEGRLQDALKLWKVVAEEWPDDPKYGAEAHIHVATCLAKIGKHEAAIDWCREAIARFPGHEKLVARAKQLEKEIRAHAAQADRRQADDRVLAEALEKLERALKEKGLRGEDLEREFARGKAKLLQEIEKKRAHEAMERAGELWKELGLTEEELEKRRRHYEELRIRQAQLESELRGLKEAAERLKAARPEMERFRKDEEALREKEEAEWRRGREKDLDAARREFAELGKRLGIPPEAVERLLAEHAGRRVEGPKERPSEPNREVEELRQGLGGLVERLHAMFAEFEHRLEETHRRIEQGEARREARFREIMERVERLEEEVRRPR